MSTKVFRVGHEHYDISVPGDGDDPAGMEASASQAARTAEDLNHFHDILVGPFAIGQQRIDLVLDLAEAGGQGVQAGNTVLDRWRRACVSRTQVKRASIAVPG
jgi:hypothetical protein